MSGLLSIGSRALLANQQTLQTAGNNVANVNTPGYSRQSVLLRNVEGQFSGGGYYGNGVMAETVLRSHSEFLTRQAALAGSVAAADTRRLEQLRQLEGLFPGGPTGLGAAVGNLLDSFSNVASAPTDLPARTVVLARADETAARFRATADGLASLQRDVRGELDASVASINSLAQRIARANKEIAEARGSGHTPNDLLDQRDQLIRDLNKLVQTTSIDADDGSVSLFLAASQPLVLGNSAASVSITGDEFGDPAKSKLAITRGAQTVLMEEASLGGGVVSGLLRFQNTDLVEAANLLGRMALGLGTTMNDQHRLGVDLAGAPGSDMFALGSVPDGMAAPTNTGGATLQVTVLSGGAPAFAASDYEVVFTSATTGSIKRLSDSQVTAFGAVPVQIDGLSLQLTGAPAAGDRFLVTPFRQAAGAIDTSFSSPRALAMASPITASAGAANGGTLTLQSLLAQQADPNLTQTVTLTFTGAGNFDVVGVGTGNPVGVAFIPGQTISYNGWALTLKGTPQIGDSYTVQANAYPHVSAGNAQAMLALRDLALFDGAPTTEGFAAVMTQIGVLVQSADSADSVSRALATSAAADEAAVSGVNLDEEAAKLLQFQQAYQASAKMLQVSQTIWDALINAVVR